MTQSNQKEKEGALRDDQSNLMNKEGFSFSGYERDPLYLNLGTKKFYDISGVSGIDSISDGRAAVFADFDNDGDLDVFRTAIQNQSHYLFRNNVGQDNSSLRIALEGGPKIGRDAFGSVVRVKTSAGTLTKIKSGGSGFISEHDARLLFGLGGDARARSIEVTWSNGEVEQFDADSAIAGKTLLLKQGTGKALVVEVKRSKLPEPLTNAENLARGLRIAVGRAMPDLQLRPISGSAGQSLKTQLKPGRRLLVNIWATWCIPCAKEMPELEKLSRRLADNKIDLIGLNVDSEAAADIKGFLKQQAVTYKNFVGGIPAIEQLYATDELTVPLSILIDDKGVILDLIPGWSAVTEKRFRELAGDQ